MNFGIIAESSANLKKFKMFIIWKMEKWKEK